jgi:hypothetical protein
MATHVAYSVGMTNQELIASLTAVQDVNDVQFDNGEYANWSIRYDDGKYLFEVGNDGDAIQVDLTRDHMLRLQAALTLTLLRDGE